MFAKVLVVDDHFETLELLRYMLELTSLEYRVLGVPSAEDALLEIRRRPYDLLITDVNLRGMNGIELVRKVLDHNTDLPIIVISGLDSRQIQDEARELGCFRYFRKPLDTDAFIEAVQKALHQPDDIQDDKLEPVEEDSRQVHHPDVSRRLESLRADTGAKQILLSSFDGGLSEVVGSGDNLELQQLAAGIASQVRSSFYPAEGIGSAEPMSIQYQAGRRYDLYSANVGRDYFLAILFDAHIRRGRIGTVSVLAQRAVSELKPLLPKRPPFDGLEAADVSLAVTAKVDPDRLSHPVEEFEKIDEQLREIDEPLTLGEIEELLGESDSSTAEEIDLDLYWDEALAEDPDSTVSTGISIEEARQQELIPSDFDVYPRRAIVLQRPTLTPTQKIMALVGLIYLSLFLFFFREVIVNIPAIWRGEVVINGDELVPFFNPQSQLIDQAAGKFNQLTNGYEFRVRYSFLTTWMRYYKVLPLAILFVIPSVVFVGYWAVARFLSKVFTQFNARDVYILTAAPVLMIFMIMIYSKITHFYTLVLGFALFLVATLAMTDGLIFPQKRPYVPIIVACIVTLLNPAVHYLILFALYMSMAVATLTLLDGYTVIRSGHWRLVFQWRRYPEYLRFFWHEWRQLLVQVRFLRSICAFALLGFLTLIPYGAFVKFVALRGVPNLAETVPGDYYFIKDASISIGHMLAFDMAGIIDKLLTGDYLARVPRWPNVVYMILMFLPLLWRRVRQQLAINKALGAFLYVAYVTTLFSMWATMGYSGASWIPTFHRTIAFISIFANDTQSTIGDLVVQLMATIVQVLRFPHRFELIMLMMACVLLPISYIWLHQWLLEKLPVGWVRLRKNLLILMVPLFFVPFFSNAPYRTVFLSGNFSGFLTPYPVEPLKQVKENLLKLPPGKVVVLPPTETAKAIVDINGIEHKFIDKFHIYYLDLPSYYYGLTGDSDNKHEFFLMLRAMYYGQGWWVNVARDLDLKYIVVNKELVANTVGGQEYLREVERIIIPELDRRSEYLTKLFQNESYVLYEFTDLPKAERVPLYIDTDWNTFLQVVSRNLELTRYYDLRYPMVLNDLKDYDQLALLTDDPQYSWLNLYIKENRENYFRPNSTILPFNPDMISSSYYLSPMFRLFQFFSNSKYNRLNMITPGLWGTIAGGFIGLPRATEFRIDVTLPEDGEYRLMMRGAASANTLDMSADFLPEPRQVRLQSEPSNLSIYNKETVFTTNRVAVDSDDYTFSEMERLIPTDAVAINFQYQFFDLGKVEGAAGKYTIYFDKLDNAPMLLEGIVVVPEDVYQEQPWPSAVQIVTKDDLCCGVLIQETEAMP